MADRTLPEFLLARIAEDEATARAAVIPAHTGSWRPHPELATWRYRGDGDEVEYDYDSPHDGDSPYRVTQDSEGLTPAVDERVGPHIARHDPARVLADCEAKRRVIAKAQRASVAFDQQFSPATSAAVFALEEVLGYLALPYAGHPDYDPAWRL